MAEWAGAIESTLDRFRSTRRLDLRAFNWRDIDPLETSAAKSWQDLVGAPSELGAKICIVLIGERIGSPLPPDFTHRHNIAERLAAHGMDWVRVPGVHEEHPGDTRVPLTGLLFEMFDAMLPPTQGGSQPELFIVMRGAKPEIGKAPHFGGGAYFQTLGAISDGEAQERAVEEYRRQRAWLKTVYNLGGLDGKRPTFWIENVEQLRERTRRILDASFGGTEETRQDLPGLLPYGVEHSELFLVRTTERTFLLSRVFPDQLPTQSQRLLLLKGPSGSGKSSMLRACLLSAARERFRCDQGWLTAFFSLAEVGHGDTLLLGLAKALAQALPMLDAGAPIATRLDSDPVIAGAKLIDHLITAAKVMPPAPVPKLLIVIDQLEVAFDQLDTEREHEPSNRAFIAVLAALGTSAASGPLAEAGRRFAELVPVTIVAALPTDRLAAVEAELRIEMGADLNVSGELGEVAVREIIVGTFERLGIVVPSAGIESMVREGLEAARESPVQPLIAIALRSLQQRWEELGRPSKGLSEVDLATYGRLETAISGLGDAAWRAIEKTAAASFEGGTEVDHYRSIKWRPLITTISMPASADPEDVRPAPVHALSIPSSVNEHSLKHSPGDMAQTGMLALVRQMFGQPMGPNRTPIHIHHNGFAPSDSQDSKRSLDPEAGLDRLLLELTRVKREETTLFVALRSAREEDLDRHSAAVAREMLNRRLLWRLPDGSLRLVHERVLGDWKLANEWLEREAQGLALLTRLEDLREKRQQHLDDADMASADALLELGKSFPQALQLWAFRRERLPRQVLEFLDAVVTRECRRPDRPDRRHDLLWIATAANWAEGVKQILATGAEIRPLSSEGRELAGQVGARWPLSWGDSVTPLHLAALCGDPVTFELLMTVTNDPHAVVEDGWSPLHLACVIGNRAIVEKLAAAGAPLEDVKYDGLTALHLAALNNQEECVAALLSAGASPKAEVPVKRWSVAHAAAYSGHVPTLRCLVGAGADISSRDSKGWQPVHSAAAAGQEAAVEALLEAGVSIECQAEDGHTVLGLAVHSGNVALMRTLIDRGASLAAKTSSGKTHLHCAAETGNLEAVRLLLDRGMSLDARDDALRQPLFSACNHGRLDVLRFLRERGADIGTRGHQGCTLLQLAAHHGRADIVRYLLEEGADIEAADELGWRPVHVAAAAGHLEVTRMLIERGASIAGSVENPAHAIHSAATKGHAEVIDLLIAQGAAVDARVGGYTSLMIAAESGHADAVACLLRHGASVRAVDEDGGTPLNFAASSENSDVVRLILEAGAAVDNLNSRGFTPLHLASDTGRTSSVKFLLDAGADPHAVGNNGWTALQLAASKGLQDIVGFLLDHGADPLVLNGEGWSAAHYAVSSGNLVVVRLMLDRRIDINAARADGHTLLGQAAHSGNRELVRALLDSGANPRLATKTGDTPLHCASQDGHISIVEALLEGGASIDTKTFAGDTALHRAAAYGRTDIVRYLSDLGSDIGTRNEQGWSPLASAANNGHVEVVAELLRRGVDIETRKRDGWTALMHAASHNNVGVVDLLLAGGADIEARLPTGETSLYIAATNKRFEAVVGLLARGANPGFENTQNRTALHEALFRGDTQSAMALMAAGAPVDGKDVVGSAPLHYAAASGDAICTAQLLAHGADIEQRNLIGATPLALAATANRAKLVQLLLLNGADANARSGNQNTPLHLAALADAVDVIGLLADAGADLEAINLHSATPLSIALDAGNTASMIELERLGASRKKAEAALETMQEAETAIMTRRMEPLLSDLQISPEETSAAFAAAMSKLSLETPSDQASIAPLFHAELVSLGVPAAKASEVAAAFLQVMLEIVHGGSESLEHIAGPSLEATVMATESSPLVRALAELNRRDDDTVVACSFFEQLATVLESGGMPPGDALAMSEQFRERIYRRILDHLVQERTDFSSL